jgi:site-specific recombinase XerD
MGGSKAGDTMHLESALLEFAFSKDHTPASQQWYRLRLGAFTVWLQDQGVTELEGITAPLVRRYVEYRRVTISPRTGKPVDIHTLHGHVRAIKALLNWGAAEGLIDERLPKRVALPKRAQKLLPILTPDQVKRLTLACESVRDRALLSVLLDTGIRASELCGLTLDRTILTQDDAYLVVYGKGRKMREVGLGKQSRQALHRYILRERGRAHTNQAVFLGRGGAALQPEGLDRMLYRLRDRAGLHGVRVGAHVWRHTYAFSYVALGGDVLRLSRLLGHTSVSTTQGYLTAFSARDARHGQSVLDQMQKGRGNA